MKIDRQNIDGLYNKVQSAIDKYFGKMVRADKLATYLRVGNKAYDRFLEEHELTDIDTIDRIIRDVITDRLNIEDSKLMSVVRTYESFRQDALNEGNDKHTDIIRILTNHYDVSAGHIENAGEVDYVVRSGLNRNGDVDVIILTSAGINNILDTIADNLYNLMKENTISYSKFNIEIKIADIVEEAPTKAKIRALLDKSKMTNVVTYISKGDMNITYIQTYDEYSIFEKN